MKVKYNDKVYTVVEEKDERVFLEDQKGNEKDIAKTTFESKATEIKELTEKELKKQQDDYLREKVYFEAFYDGEKYVDDVIVTINGTNYQIQRGKRIKIPRFVYNALEAHERQRGIAANTSEKFREKYKKLEKRINN